MTTLAVVAGAAWLVAAGATARPAEPRIAVEPEGFDFGAARQSRTLTKEFQVRNFGGAELVVERITTSCGCTVTHLGDERIPPGGSSPMRVSLDTRTDEGRVVRQVLIESNDPERPRLTVEISATVVPD